MTTGWVWDERYMWHDPGRRGRSLAGGEWVEPEDHAETPATKRRFRNLVDVSGLLAHLVSVDPQPASRESLLRIHDAAYLDRIAQASEQGGGDAGENATFAPGGYEIAALAAGGCIAAVDAVLDGRVDNVYALVRPPGHHAEADRGRGFCLIANVAVAARHAQAQRGIGRVAIVDWDVHHGNGPQKLFWTDPSVLTLSVHQDGYYPADSGRVTEAGADGGRGYNINVPLPAGSGVGAYSEAFRQVVVPALHAYRPELILVSSGLDASALEPQAQMMLHSDGYRMLAELVLTVANEVCAGKLVLCHEGGYSTTYAPFCGLAVVEALAGVRTAVRDPYLEAFTAISGQDIQPHQAAAIRGARDAVLNESVLRLGEGV